MGVTDNHKPMYSNNEGMNPQKQIEMEMDEMNRKTIIEAFLNGETKGKASSLSLQGDTLFSYATAIAQRIDGQVYVNVTKYSPTTTRQQNELLRECPEAIQIEYVVPQGTYNLKKFV